MCERNGYNKAHQPFMIDSFDEQRTRASRLHVYKSNCRCESRRARTCQTVGVCDTEPSLCRKLMTKSTSFSAALSRVVSVTVSAVCLTELSKTYRITVGRRLHSQATQTRHAVECRDLMSTCRALSASLYTARASTRARTLGAPPSGGISGAQHSTHGTVYNSIVQQN